MRLAGNAAKSRPDELPAEALPLRNFTQSGEIAVSSLETELIPTAKANFQRKAPR